MTDGELGICALACVVCFAGGAWTGWAAEKQEIHEQAVAAGHAEYRYVEPAGSGYGHTEFVWFPPCRKDGAR